MNDIFTNKIEIPIFFATDDNYAPFLGVALTSLSENLSDNYTANIHVLSTNLSSLNKRRLLRSVKDNCTLSFTDVSEQLRTLVGRLHLRDYYTATTYYRFFIADLFPQYDKALYLDCDIVLNGDVSRLYNVELGNKLVAAVVEEVMQKVDIFGKYVEKVLEMPRERYFNAGVLVMNLREIRRINLKREFERLLSRRRFDVTQDQDYLNVICYGKAKILGLEWNKTPLPDPDFADRMPYLVHYKINWKPWHYKNVLYEEIFWEYARRNLYYRTITRILENYSDEEKRTDSEAYIKLCRLAESQTRNAELTYTKKA